MAAIDAVRVEPIVDALLDDLARRPELLRIVSVLRTSAARTMSSSRCA